MTTLYYSRPIIFAMFIVVCQFRSCGGSETSAHNKHRGKSDLYCDVVQNKQVYNLNLSMHQLVKHYSV